MSYKVISSDDHVSEGPGTWVDRVPARMRDQVPQIQVLNGISTWCIGSEPTQRLGPVRDAEELEIRKATARFQTRPGDWDPVERLKDYTLDSVDAGVLFPNYSGFTGDPCNMVKGHEVQMECIRAYNDWLVDEFCATDPTRLIPLALLPAWDIELAIGEATRAVKSGHRGVIWGAALDVFGYTPTWEKYWDPFYAAVQEMGIPLVFHQPSAMMDRAIFQDPSVKMPQYMRSSASINHVQSLIYPCVELMMSGILERHPKLDVFFAESGASWIPYTLNQCDYYWPRYSRFDGNELRMLPSDYWRRQCYAGFWTDIISPQVVDWLGEDNVLWEGDYLHTIATFPNSRNIQAESLKDIVDSNIRAKILAGNSVKLFKLD